MRFLSVILVSLLMVACSGVPKNSASLGLINTSDSRYIQRQGRFSVLVYDKLTHRSIDSVQGLFTWVSDANYSVLDLNSPLGQTLARIDIHPSHATLTEADGHVTKAKTPEELIVKVIGWEMPISGLTYWLKGSPMPIAPFSHVIYDTQRKISAFRQLGWRVSLQQYDTVGPKRFELINENTKPSIKIKILVYSS